MKIIRDNKVYVQAKDIAVLANSGYEVPQEVVYEIFQDYNHTSSSRMQNLERYLCFEGYEAVRYFGGLDWIIDYDTIKDADLDKCLGLLHKCLDEKNAVLGRFEEIRSEKTEQVLLDRVNFLDHKNQQLKDITVLLLKNEPLPVPSEFKKKRKFGKKGKSFLRKRG